MTTHPLRRAADAALGDAHKSHFDTLIAALGREVQAARPDVDRFTLEFYIGMDPHDDFVDSLDVGTGLETTAGPAWVDTPVADLGDGLTASARVVLGVPPAGQRVWLVEVQPATGSWSRLEPAKGPA